MNIIAKYEPDAPLLSAHEEIWFGQFPDTESDYSADDLAQLETLGWHEDEESWHHFT